MLFRSELIEKLVEQSARSLRGNGHLLLEADPEQHRAIIKQAMAHGFSHKETKGYALSFMKLPQA